jgi:hypothetical protein
MHKDACVRLLLPRSPSAADVSAHALKKEMKCPALED